MQTTEAVEVERKYAADRVDREDFRQYMVGRFGLMASKGEYRFIKGYDDYYRQGQNVLRHRFYEGQPVELTVKCRTSLVSTESRHEIDLPLGATSVKTVHDFLTLSGWVPELSLFKSADIYHVASESLPVIIALYDIVSLDEKAPGQRRFIEVEAKKCATISREDAVRALNFWEKLLSHLDMDIIPNLSLYEIYTGKSYKVV